MADRELPDRIQTFDETLAADLTTGAQATPEVRLARSVAMRLAPGTAAAAEATEGPAGQSGETAPEGRAMGEAAAAPAAGAQVASVPRIVDRTWTDGATGDWYDANRYTSTFPDGSAAPAGAPMPGDIVRIRSGTVTLVGSEAADNGTFNANVVYLGASGPATLQAQQATLGPSFQIYAEGQAQLVSSQGTSTFQGSVFLEQGNVTLGSVGGANLILAGNAPIVVPTGVTANESLTLVGNITMDGVSSFQAPSTLTVTNNADVTIVGLSNHQTNPAYGNAIEGAIGGTGTFHLGLASDLRTSGAIGSGQTIAFASPGAQFDIGDVADFQGHVTNFASGDVIGLTGLTYDAKGTMAASYNAQTSTLTVTDGSQTVATLNQVGAQSAPLFVTNDLRDGGISIGYQPDPTNGLPAQYVRPDPAAEIQGSDMAMRSNVVRATDVVPGTTTPIDGTGVKIGIISTSFDNTGTADANQAAGFLPAVDVIADAPGGGDDEGQAMAEEVHQVAPGAQIDFCAADDGTAGFTQATFAAAVRKLQADGCKIIVDDISIPTAPRYQQAGPADDAVQAAVNAGIDYFAATGNEGQAFLNQTFNPGSATLKTANGAQTVTTHIFDNGTPYERITVPAIGNGSTDTLYLQWNSPYLEGGTYSSTARQPLRLQLFDSNGNVVPNSQPNLPEVSGQNVSVESIALPQSSTSQTYYFAVEETGSGTAPTAFNVTLEKAGGGTGGGGVIDDPQAGMGSDVVGPKLLPGVNSVGEIFYGESAAFGQQPTTNIAESSYGSASQIDYAPDSATPLSQPQVFDKPNFTAPSGTVTTVPGSFAEGFFGSSAAAPNAAAVAALMLQANPNLTTAQVTRLLAQSAIPFGNPNQSGSGLIQADRAVAAAIALVPACYVAGTRIATIRGEVAVETLAVGDLVVTASGAHRPIRWLGRRSYVGRFANRNPDVLPICFKTGSLGEGVPTRDLWVSPKHAMFLDGALVPAEHLVDGIVVIKATRVDIVHYHHVELDSHDILLADGAASESYVDDDNRRMFHNAAEFEALDQHAAVPDAVYCAPRLEQGPQLETIRARLAERARHHGTNVLEGGPGCRSSRGWAVRPTARGAFRR